MIIDNNNGNDGGADDDVNDGDDVDGNDGDSGGYNSALTQQDGRERRRQTLWDELDNNFL